ncbi:hypothetical protein H5410_045655 [Solanum commersonii]|uniref:Uncharacterized protein n=1 Tax=Solanum commersonii TaxID=4109 RepID=A0A9J5XC82_SOLCO|nr:hypothetical protein H5410_045655 [Solanum commersonii]
MMLLINPNQNWAATLKSLFSIRAPTSIHLGVVSEIKGPSQHRLYRTPGPMKECKASGPGKLIKPMAFYREKFLLEDGSEIITFQPVRSWGGGTTGIVGATGHAGTESTCVEIGGTLAESC